MWSAILGSLAGSAGNIAGSLLGYRNTKKLMNMQNDFTERMSNTAYQRGVADLKAAGLNPLLATNSAGASTPTAGSGGSGPSFDVGDTTSGYVALKQAKAQVQNLQANTAYAKEQALTEQNKRDNLDADSAFKTAENVRQNSKLPYETRKMAAETQNLIAQSELNKEIAKYTGYNANTARISANASQANVGANYISANAARDNAAAKTISQYAGKWVEDKFKSLAGSRFGKDMANFGRLFYHR